MILPLETGFSQCACPEQDFSGWGVHGVLDTPVPLTRHRVVTCCDHFLPHRSHCVFQRHSRLHPTKPINEPGFLEVFSELVFAESSCVPIGDPSFVAPSCVRFVQCMYLRAKFSHSSVVFQYGGFEVAKNTYFLYISENS